MRIIIYDQYAFSQRKMIRYLNGLSLGEMEYELTHRPFLKLAFNMNGFTRKFY